MNKRVAVSAVLRRPQREVAKLPEKPITLSLEVRTCLAAKVATDLKHCCSYRPEVCIAPLGACSTPCLIRSTQSRRNGLLPRRRHNRADLDGHACARRGRHQ